MKNCGALMKSALVAAAVVLVALIHSGSAAEKLAKCCEKVNSQEIKEPITGFMIQKPSAQCVRAVIFQTEKGLFCSQINAPWVRRKIFEFQRAKAQASPSPAAPSSTASLLSIITSTTFPPSSSTPVSTSTSLPSSSSSPLPSSSSSPLPSSSSSPLPSSSSSPLPSSSSSPLPSSSSSPLPSSSSSPLPSSSSSPPPPPSSSLPFLSSTAEIPAGETFSESDEE